MIVLIDHNFASRALLQTVTAVATVAPGPAAVDHRGGLCPRRQPVSDHALVVADLELT